MNIAIVQARMGSTRFFGKVLKPLCGKPLVVQLLQRLHYSISLDKIILATTTASEDDVLVETVEQAGYEVMRGSALDVLDRTYQCAKKFKPKWIVRLTADNPLLDPSLIDHMLSIVNTSEPKWDYYSNIQPAMFPDGLDIEIVSFETLEQAWKEARLSFEREHVMPFVWQKPHRFRLGNLFWHEDLSHWRLTVDTENDFKLVQKIYDTLYATNKKFRFSDIVCLLKKNPNWLRINQDGVRNESLDRQIADNDQAKKSFSNSQMLFKRARNIIPAYTQTLSKGPSQFTQGSSPMYLQRGKGSHVWDVDGHKYIDYSMGLGSVLLGHAFTPAIYGLYQQLNCGTSFSLMHPLEVTVSEKLVASIPCAQMVRFAKNGSDVTTAAIRVARAYTGRTKIASCGYHGWHDWMIGNTSRNKGIPKSVRNESLTFQYNNIDSLKTLFKSHKGEIAAVILEPVGFEPPKNKFLEEVRSLVTEYGSVLIFDEVVTGFRFHLGGAQAYFNVTPDLACFGKGLANGLPLSALVGKSNIMKNLDEVFFSTTFGGEALSLQAASQVLDTVKLGHVVRHIWEKGLRLKEGINKLLEQHDLLSQVECLGYPPRTLMKFKGNHELMLKTFVQQEMIKRNILFVGFHNLSLSHSDEDIRQTLKAYAKTFQLLKKSLKDNCLEEKIHGTHIEPVFRML